MTENYKVGAVGVYDKSRVAAIADKWFVIANVTMNGNRYVKYDTDVYASKEDAEKVALVMALRNAGKDETSHPNEFGAASLVNKIGTSNGMTKTQIVAARASSQAYASSGLRADSATVTTRHCAPRRCVVHQHTLERALCGASEQLEGGRCKEPRECLLARTQPVIPRQVGQRTTGQVVQSTVGLIPLLGGAQ